MSQAGPLPWAAGVSHQPARQCPAPAPGDNPGLLQPLPLSASYRVLPQLPGSSLAVVWRRSKARKLKSNIICAKQKCKASDRNLARWGGRRAPKPLLAHPPTAPEFLPPGSALHARALAASDPLLQVCTFSASWFYSSLSASSGVQAPAKCVRNPVFLFAAFPYCGWPLPWLLAAETYGGRRC